jgi:hypothetical protein
MWVSGLPPRDIPVALALRVWSADIGNGVTTRVIASDPADYEAALEWFYGRCLRFTPSLTVRMGKLVLRGGKVCVLDEYENPVDYGTDAILGWAHLPAMLPDVIAAKVTERFVNRLRAVDNGSNGAPSGSRAASGEP